MKDKILQKIFTDSEKAEFLEGIQKYLPGCKRALICFETEIGGTEMSEFRYFLLGFNQFYEVLGFMRWLEGMVINETDEGGD